MLHGSVNGHHHIGLTPVLAPMWLARSKRWAREYWTSRPATKSMAAPAHPTDCRSPINSNSTPTFWLSSRAEPGNQHRRIFDAVARTASSLKRDRRFADSLLEGAGFELPVPLLRKRVPGVAEGRCWTDRLGGAPPNRGARALPRLSALA